MSIPYMPPDLSKHGEALDALNFWVHVLMAVLFVGWGAFFLLTLVKFRSGANPKADYHGVKGHTSSYLEIAVAVIECALLFGLSIPLWNTWVRDAQMSKDALHVRVVAQQFQWNVQYPGPDGKFGRLDSQLVDEALNGLGRDYEDPNGRDDVVTVNQLIVPKDRPVVIHVTTKDVIHSFFLPVVRVKQDTMPGQSIRIQFEAKQTSAEFRDEEAKNNPKFETPDAVPSFEIACAQLCGGQHYRMVGQFHIVTQEEFANLQTTAAVTAFTTGRNAKYTAASAPK
ncbi:MAG: cytochrome c oxidase subunit II [Planctomycetota bacterium]